MLSVDIEKIIPVTEARDMFNKIVDEVEGSDELYVLTKNGKPAAVVVGVNHLEKLTGESTSEIMAKADQAVTKETPAFGSETSPTANDQFAHGKDLGTPTEPMTPPTEEKTAAPMPPASSDLTPETPAATEPTPTTDPFAPATPPPASPTGPTSAPGISGGSADANAAPKLESDPMAPPTPTDTPSTTTSNGTPQDHNRQQF